MKTYEQQDTTGDQKLTNVQEAVSRFAGQVSSHEAFKSPLNFGERITDISLASGTSTKISHSLGRIPTGWLVIDTTTAPARSCNIYRTAWDIDTISLYNTDLGAIVVDLWVF